MTPSRLVIYVAIGQAATKSARISCDSLIEKFYGEIFINSAVIDNDLTGRATKTSLPQFIASDMEYVLYLDADTTVHASLFPLFEILEDGWDMVIAPSTYQGEQALQHIGDIERQETLDIYGFTPLQLQGGVIAFANTEVIQQFFGAWHYEWTRHKGQDQAALLRALRYIDLNIWIVGNAFNGGEVIQHHFGSIS